MDQITFPNQNQPPVSAVAPEARLHFLDYWRVIRIRKAIIITVFLITAIIATAVTFILPESYASTCKMKIENYVNDAPGGEAPLASQTMYDPYFIQSEFEIINSQLVLSNVIASLNLNVEWGKKYFNGETLKTTETIEILRGRVALAPVKNTKLIQITVYSDDKNEASLIANTIAESYRKWRVDQRSSSSGSGLKVAQDQFSSETNQMGLVQANVEHLRDVLGIRGDDPSQEHPTRSISDEELAKYHAEMLDKESKYQEQLTQLQKLQAINATNALMLRDVLPLIAPDGALSGLLDQYKGSDQKLTQLKNDYGTNNPNVQREQSLKEKLDQEINERVTGVMTALDTQVASLKASLDWITLKVEDAKTNDAMRAAKYQPYYDEKAKLIQLRNQNDLTHAKLLQQLYESKIPKTQMAVVTDPAEPSKAPVKPNKTLNIVLGLIFGLIMGIGLAFFIEYLDTSVKTIDDVERTFNAPVLGVIPQNIGYLVEDGSESKHAEAYRVLRTNLLFSRRDEHFNTIVVVSAGAGEGKSTTTINLATVFAQAGNRVLVVDSDLRRPTLHKIFKVTNNMGLTNYLLKQNTIAEVVQTTSLATLDFMPSGKLPNSSMGILGSQQMKDMIKELKQRYDFIFFDSPPILGVSDASILASEVDMVMQVIQYRRYPQLMTIRAKQMIEKVGGNFVGMVLNNINMSQDEGYYYYSGYYHDYYYSRTPAEQEAEAAKSLPAGDKKGDDTEFTGKQKR
jgi:capsular exopolysaccharide synthesis family protein